MLKYSFYYRDTFCLRNVFPKAIGFSLAEPYANVILDNGCIRLEDPEVLDARNLHIRVQIHKDNGDYEEVIVGIRCWRINGPYLKEVTRFQRLKCNHFFQKFCRGLKKIFKTGYNTILLTKEGNTYYTFGGKLRWKSNKKGGILSSQVKLERPEYNQMLKEGEYGFIRSGDTIYASIDSLQSWKIIHQGSHALRKSMIWDNDTQSLIFSNYTGGSERVRHYLRRYNVNTEETDTILTFYTKKEHDEQGLAPFARHIHIISEDPYTGDWYVAVGDYEDEPAIYRSTDKGRSFEIVGGGDQMWRTLSFIFKKDYILWGADSESPQYLSCISRKQLCNLPIKDVDVKRYPLFNSALWFTYDDDKMTIMSSNSEGSLYDDYHRVYGIVVNDEGIPTVYSLFEEKSDPNKNRYVYNQLCFLEKDIKDRLWFYDYQNSINRQFKLVK